MPIYEKILKNINQAENAALFEEIVLVVAPHSNAIAENFYREMLTNQQAASFLNNGALKEYLIASMTAWINTAFLYHANEKALEDYTAYQRKIGHTHAKIGLPVSLVSYGMYIIKQDILRLLVASELKHDDLGAVLIIANQILDCALQIINESYENDLIVNEKNSQAFKLQFSTHHLAFDCERLRTSLSDWMRDLMMNLHQNLFDDINLVTIKQSNFGLWITHKAKLFLSDRPELNHLIQLLDAMDETVNSLLDAVTIEPEYRRITDGPKTHRVINEVLLQEKLKNLNAFVSQASWVLGEIAKEMIDQDNGRDSLTRLFNRRYLDTVMRHETLASLKSGMVFGVLMVDIDFFKKINDTYGHDDGDRVLAQLAEILTHEVRAGDFVFRLGGEEFLIVLSDINRNVIRNIGEKIRIAIANTVFQLGNHKTLVVTISIGTAVHDGHPDFHRTIKLADKALYQAKQTGRDQVIAAYQPDIAETNLEKQSN